MTDQHPTQADDTARTRSHERTPGSRLTLRERFAHLVQRAQIGWLLGVVALAPLGMGARGCDHAVVGADCTKDGDGGSAACACESGGKHYAAGDTFKSTDGCNTCSCQKDGKVACTSRACGGAPDGGGGGDSGDSGNTCGGLAGASCDKGEYCKFAPKDQCGAADQTGTCATKPQICDTIYAPVCGCDDKTYSSDCTAASSGISVASQGECKSSGAQDAGTSAGTGCDYDGKHYAFGASFAATDGCNKCTCDPIGVACTEIGCKPDGGSATCDGLKPGPGCGANEFCNHPISAQCGTTGQTGTCEAIPSACTKEYLPVCGCDGTTYGNACSAAAAGVSAATEGECADAGVGAGCDFGGVHYNIGDNFLDADNCNQCSCIKSGETACTLKACAPTGKACGGIAGIQCDGEQYCDFPPATMCGSGDQSGACNNRPQTCRNVVIRPVCGCDGNNYDSACYAALAGVSVLSTGTCNSK